MYIKCFIKCKHSVHRLVRDVDPYNSSSPKKNIRLALLGSMFVSDTQNSCKEQTVRPGLQAL